MMIHFQGFLLTLIEITSIMLLWDALMKEKRNVIKYSIIIVATSVIVKVDTSLNFTLQNYISYIFLILITMVLFKKKIDEVLMEFGIVLISTMIIQIVIMAFISILKVKSHTVFIGFIINSTLLIITVIINKFLPIGRIYNNYKSYIRKAYLFLINIIFYVLITKFVWESNNKFFVDNMLYLASISIAFIVFNIIFLINNIRYQEQRKIVETYNKYSPIMSNLIEDIKRRQHDFKNHLNTIYGIIQTCDEKEMKNTLKDYIKSINDSIEDNNNIIQVKNEIIAAIIYNKICDTKYKSINFQYEIDNTINMKLKQYELSEVVNNLLNNAFEAAEKTESDNRRVQLKIYENEFNSIIEVKNTFKSKDISNIDKFFVKGFSTKLEKNHGYGLYNIKKIVEANKGRIQLSVEEDVISFKLLF